ncbi:hypothetical protein [Aquabacterium sp.]|nr:hypothetical protein [Aquabacterium sp.]
MRLVARDVEQGQDRRPEGTVQDLALFNLGIEVGDELEISEQTEI